MTVDVGEGRIAVIAHRHHCAVRRDVEIVYEIVSARGHVLAAGLARIVRRHCPYPAIDDNAKPSVGKEEMVCNGLLPDCCRSVHRRNGSHRYFLAKGAGAAPGDPLAVIRNLVIPFRIQRSVKIPHGNKRRQFRGCKIAVACLFIPADQCVKNERYDDNSGDQGKDFSQRRTSGRS